MPRGEVGVLAATPSGGNNEEGFLLLFHVHLSNLAASDALGGAFSACAFEENISPVVLSGRR